MSVPQRSIARGVAWSLARTWGSRLAGFFIYFQLARLLTPADMGLFAAGFAVLTLIELLVDFGLVQAVVQRREISSRLLNAVFFTNLTLAGAVIIGLYILAPAIADLMQSPGLASVVTISSAALLFGALGACQEALARRELDFQLLAKRTLLSTILSGVLGVALAFAGAGVWALVAQFVVASLLNMLMLWTTPRWRPAFDCDFRGLSELLKFGANVLGIRLVNFGAVRGVDLLVSVLLGTVALGFFSVGSKLQYIFLQLLGTALVDVIHPVLSRLQNDPRRFRETHLASISAVSTASLPIWALLGALAPEATRVAFGARWADASQVLQLMVIVGAVQLLNSFDSAALNAAGHPRKSLGVSVIRTAAILTAIFLSGGSSLEAVCQGLVIAHFVALPFYVFTVHKVLGIPVTSWLTATLPPAGCAIAAWVVTELMRRHIAEINVVPRTALLGCGLLTIYLALMYLFGRPHLERMMAKFFKMRLAT